MRSFFFKNSIRAPKKWKIWAKKVKKMSVVEFEHETSILLSAALPNAPTRLLWQIGFERHTKKTKKYFLELERKLETKFVGTGTTGEIIWANFGDPVTSNLVRNKPNAKKTFFGTPLFLRRFSEPVIPPPLRKKKSSVKFGKNSRNAEDPKGEILVGMDKYLLLLYIPSPTSWLCFVLQRYERVVL